MQAPKQHAGAPLAGPLAKPSVPPAADSVVGVIDLGSSAIKCMYCRVYEPVALHLAARIPTPTLGSGLQSEFSPSLLDAAIEQAVIALAKAAAGRNVIAIAITGQIGGVLLVDTDGRLISPSLTWADRRAADHAQLFAQTFEGRFESILGHALPAQTCWSAPKIRRLFEHDHATMTNVACVMQLPDYAFYRMTGSRQSSPTIGISLVNQQQNQYAPAMLQWTGLREDQLPTLPQTQAAGGRLSGTLASLWRQTTGGEQNDSTLPMVILAGADMYCGLHGSGAGPGQAIIQSGTTEIAGVVAHHTHQPAMPGSVLRLKLPNHSAPESSNLDVIYGSTSNGGMSLTWLEQKHGLSLRDESLWTHASQIHDHDITSFNPAADSKNLIFIPHLHGARAPLWRDDATGGFTKTSCTNQDGPRMLLAVLQGCAINKLAVLQAAGADLTHTKDQPVIVAGGGAHQTLANRIRANVLSAHLLARNVADVTAAGAIAIALDHLNPSGKPGHIEGSHWLKQLHAAAGSSSYEPDPLARAYYQSLYKQYQHAEQAMFAGISLQTHQA